MVGSKRDAAGKFQEHLLDLQDALAKNRIGPLRDAVEQNAFPKQLVEFLKAITRLPVDDQNVQGWTRLYNEGRVALERSQTQVFIRKSEG